MIIKDIPYITGTKKTIADVVLYYVLHSIMVITYCNKLMIIIIYHLYNIYILLYDIYNYYIYYFFTEKIKSSAKGTIYSRLEMVRQYPARREIETGIRSNIF